MEWSSRQKDIFDVTENYDTSLIIDAYAGTGKTSTIVEACNLIDPSKSTTFVAFNKSIATELESRLASNIRAMTLHKMGLKAIYYANKSTTVDDFKCRTIYRQLRGQSDIESQVMRLVSLGKSSATTDPNFDKIMDDFEIVVDAERVQESVDMARIVFKQSANNHSTVDFDDMIYFPAMGYVSLYKQDVIFVDERQDLSPAQVSMLRKAVKSSGRVIAAGDDRQAIYAFRGADTAVTAKLKADFNAMVLPLDICYRCGRKIVELAQTIVPEIQPSPYAIDGEICTTSEKKLYGELQPDDLILCRTNAPLVQTALRCIKQGIKAQIRGRDIGKSLEQLIAKVSRKYITDSLPMFLSSLRDYAQTEIAKLMAVDKNGPAMMLADQTETIIALAEGANSLQDIMNRIATIFSDNVVGVMLSSVHRAKGTEANRVYIIRPDLIPHPMAKSPVQRQQEMNLKYVAATRAKQVLTFVGEGGWYGRS